MRAGELGPGNKLVGVALRAGREPASRLLVGFLVAALVLGGVAALAITRELRGGDDVVNSVKVTTSFSPADEDARSARIRFELTDPDQEVVVEVIDSEQAVTRTLARQTSLAAGAHRFEWDGRTESGTLAPEGRYRVRIELGEQDREVFLRGVIRVESPGGA